MRYLHTTDIGKLQHSLVRHVLAVSSYIDPKQRSYAWYAGETVPLLGKLKYGRGIVVRSRYTGMVYVLENDVDCEMFLDKIG